MRRKNIWKLGPPPFKISRYTTADPGCSVKKIWSLVLGPPTLEMLPPSLKLRETLYYIHNASQVSVSSILSSQEKTRNPAAYPKYTTT